MFFMCLLSVTSVSSVAAYSADSSAKQKSLVRKGIENDKKENIGANNGN
jgi:hypothetical protein